MAMPRFAPVTSASTLARWSTVFSAAALALSGCTSSSGPGPAASSAQVSVSAASANPGPSLPSTTDSSSRSSSHDGGTKSSTPRSTGTPTSINGGTGGSGGHPPGTAVTAYQAWTADWNAGRYRDMWSALPPEQQGQVSAQAFAACEQDQAQQVGATGIVYQRTVRQRTTTMVTASNTHTLGVAITADIYFDGRDPVTSKLTLVWYADGRAWRWLLDDSSLHAYRSGSCPS